MNEIEMNTLASGTANEVPCGPLHSLWHRLRAAWGGVSMARRVRRLRLCESLALGEKRLLALVECDGQRLLLAVTAERIALLQHYGKLDPAATPDTSAGERPERLSGSPPPEERP